MSEEGNGGGNGPERVTLPLEALVDELVLTFDRRDGRMAISGKVCSDEVALMMLLRAVNVYEARTRALMAMQLREQALETARVQDLVNRTRGGRQ